jgi:ribosome biogenesis GTPase
MTKPRQRKQQSSKPIRIGHIARRAPDMFGVSDAFGKGRIETNESRQAVKRLLTADDPDDVASGEHRFAPKKRIETLRALDDIGAQTAGDRRFGRVIEVYKGHCLIEDIGPVGVEPDGSESDDESHVARAKRSAEFFDRVAERNIASGLSPVLRRATWRGLAQAFNIGSKNIVVAGDRVRFVVKYEEQSESDITGLIVSREPRSSCLSRPAWDGVGLQHIAANADILFAVLSFNNPPLSEGLLDRISAFAESELLPLVFVINKLDLADADPAIAEVSADVIVDMRDLGYPVIETCVLDGRGINEVRERMAGVVPVFFGHSGVGKSSLLNAIDPALGLRRGEVRERTGRGSHTTNHATWFQLSDGGAAIDTPGIRAFGLHGITRQTLAFYFREFRALIPNCRYRDCLHNTEPDCAVREAANNGIISARRYNSYLRILESV